MPTTIRDATAPQAELATDDQVVPNTPALTPVPVPPTDTFVRDVPRNLSGRTAAPNALTGTLSSVNPNVATSARVYLSSKLREYGLGHLEEMYDLGGGEIALPYGAALALRFSEQRYEIGDPHIRRNPVSRVCDEAFAAAGRDITWLETSGVVELGHGGEGTLSLGAPHAGTVMRYRRLEPYETYSGRIPTGEVALNTAQIPVTASLARKMPAGGEFQLTGECRAGFMPSFGQAGEFARSALQLGLSAEFNVGGDYRGEVSVSVQKLPQRDHVLVKVNRSHSSNMSVGFNVEAGSQLPAAFLGQIPELGQGVMKFFLEKLGLPNLPSLVKLYGQASMSASAHTSQHHGSVASFVFDLSKPAACTAYEQVFRRISLQDALSLSRTVGSGVRLQEGEDHQSNNGYGIEADVGSGKLFLMQALRTEREGRLSESDGGEVIYRDASLSNHYADWISGRQDATWEQVSVQNPSGQHKNYARLQLRNQYYDLQRTDINAFFSFVKALSSHHEDARLNATAEQLSTIIVGRDDAEMAIDLYFTDAGVRKIESVDEASIVAAHLVTQGEFDPQLAGLPSLNGNAEGFRLLSEYNRLQNQWFFQRWFSDNAQAEMNTRYQALTGGRSIQTDALALANARAFAEQMAHWKSFVPDLKGVSAMAKLAGEENTLIHHLALKSAGVSVACMDEGEVVHPEQELAVRLAQLLPSE